MGEHKARYWYEYNFDTKDYAPCSEPVSLSDVGFINDTNLPFEISLKNEKITSLGFYKI